MKWRLIALGGWGLLLISWLPAMASSGGNCVAYAREMTGIHLDGNAASWWPHAEGHYDRGHKPAVGAVLVFKPYGGMHVGHVAVVSQVVSPREVLVDQANWVRGRVTHSMSVVDASPLNDWTSVKVQYSGTHGRENPTYGFIYPHVLPASFGETIIEPQQTAKPIRPTPFAAPTRRNPTINPATLAGRRRRRTPRLLTRRTGMSVSIPRYQRPTRPRTASPPTSRTTSTRRPTPSLPTCISG